MIISGNPIPDGPNRDPCGQFQPQLLSESEGIITSPNFPQNYAPNLDCSWLITTSETRAVEIEIHSFETENL